MSRRGRHITGCALALVCLLASGAPVLTAAFPPPDAAVPPVRPVPPLQADTSQPLPVPPDTVMVDLAWPPPGDGILVDVQPDTLLLGEPCRLVFADLRAAVPDSLPWPGWFEPDGVVRVTDPAGAWAVVVRPYRLGPFRVRTGGETSRVVLVRGRLAEASVTAPVRAPRAPGWSFRAVLLAAALVVLMAAGAWWLARRRWGGGPLGRDRQPAPAAWPRTAVDLAALLDFGFAPGSEREFLDRLTALVRAHVARRFLVHGREMTADEIAIACGNLGYERPAARPFVRLVDRVDRRRYDPEPVSESFCREQVACFLAAIAAVRIAPAAGSLPGTEIARGERAWLRLRTEFAAAGGGGRA